MVDGEKSKDEQRVKQLWHAYVEHDCQNARKELIIHYSPLVKYVVGRMMIYLPPYLDHDDLLSYGTLGLIGTIESFDPNHGVKFSTYAMARIKGAILDAIRSLDWVPRSVREKSKDLSRVFQELEQKQKRPPTDEELAKYMNLSQDQMNDLLSKVAVPQVLSLENMLTGNDEEGRIPQEVAGPEEDNPLQKVEIMDLKDTLAHALNRLKKQEKMVITLYYYEGLTLREIGDVLDLSTARISQLHTRAVLRLRGMLSREKQSLF